MFFDDGVLTHRQVRQVVLSCKTRLRAQGSMKGQKTEILSSSQAPVFAPWLQFLIPKRNRGSTGGALVFLVAPASPAAPGHAARARTRTPISPYYSSCSSRGISPLAKKNTKKQEAAVSLPFSMPADDRIFKATFCRTTAPGEGDWKGGIQQGSRQPASLREPVKHAPYPLSFHHLGCTSHIATSKQGL